MSNTNNSSCIVVLVATSAHTGGYTAEVFVNGYSRATFTHADRALAVQFALENWASRGAGRVVQTADGWEFRGAYETGRPGLPIDVQADPKHAPSESH